jgi:hypothetical protein
VGIFGQTTLVTSIGIHAVESCYLLFLAALGDGCRNTVVGCILRYVYVPTVIGI